MENRKSASNGSTSRTRTPSRLMYGVVRRVIEGNRFAFARSEGQDIFLHFNSGRVIRGSHYGKPYLVRDDEGVLDPKVGDKLAMLVVDGERGLKAIMWAHDLNPLPFNYMDVVSGWRSFVGALRADGFGFTLHSYELEQAANAAQQYLDRRIDDLVKSRAQLDRCYYRAILEVEAVEHVAKRLDLDLDVGGILETLRKAEKPSRLTDPVERVVKEMLQELEAGHPCSADKVYNDNWQIESDRLDRARQGTRSGSRRLYPRDMTGDEWQQMELEYAPFQVAFRSDWSLRMLNSRCFQAVFKMKRALLFAVEKAYLEGRINEIPAIWKKAHEADPAFEADSYFDDSSGPGIYEWCQVGAFDLLDELKPLMEADGRYERSLRSMDEYLPPTRSEDPFAQLVDSIEDHLRRGFAETMDGLYKKYVVQTGCEQAFLAGDPARAELLERMRALLPLEAIQGPFFGIFNFDHEQAVQILDASLKLYGEATAEMRQHPYWVEVETSLVYAELKCERYEDALQRFLRIRTEFPNPPGVDRNWGDVAQGIYAHWVGNLCRSMSFDEVIPTLKAAPEVIRQNGSWTVIQQNAIKELRESGRSDLARELADSFA